MDPISGCNGVDAEVSQTAKVKPYKFEVGRL